MKEIVKRYTELRGVAGNERLVKEEFEKCFKGADELFHDNLGSIAACIKSKKNNPKKIGIFAHMDEVGLLISKIEDNGIIKIINLGGITVESLICQRVSYTNEEGKEFLGVVMSPSPHMRDTRERTLPDLEINFGLISKEDAQEKGFILGTQIDFIGDFKELTNNNFVAKAADNRVGCAIVEKLYTTFKDTNIDFELILGATVQEEMGLRGAASLLNAINKDLDQIIIIDTSPVDGMEEITLGGGPLLRVAEPKLLYDLEGSKEIRNAAKKHNVKYQHYMARGRTDGSQMQITNIGYKVNSICTPAYNLHTNSSIFNLDDIEGVVELIKCFLEEIK